MKYEHDSTYLAHYGILGQKWGVRRFQNEDGTLTAAGKERYYSSLDTRRDPTNEEREKVQYYQDLQDSYFYDKDMFDHDHDDDTYYDPYDYRDKCPKDIFKQIDSYEKKSNKESLFQEQLQAIDQKARTRQDKRIYSESFDGKMEKLFSPQTYAKKILAFDTKIAEGEKKYQSAWWQERLNALNFVEKLKPSLEKYSEYERNKILAFAFYWLT